MVVSSSGSTLGMVLGAVGSLVSEIKGVSARVLGHRETDPLTAHPTRSQCCTWGVSATHSADARRPAGSESLGLDTGGGYHGSQT